MGLFVYTLEGINELEKDLTHLERDGLLKVHDQFYQD